MLTHGDWHDFMLSILECKEVMKIYRHHPYGLKPYYIILLYNFILHNIIDVTHMVLTESLAEVRRDPNPLQSPKIILTGFSATQTRPLDELPVSPNVMEYFDKVHLKVESAARKPLPQETIGELMLELELEVLDRDSGTPIAGEDLMIENILSKMTTGEDVETPIEVIAIYCEPFTLLNIRTPFNEIDNVILPPIEPRINVMEEEPQKPMGEKLVANFRLQKENRDPENDYYWGLLEWIKAR